MGAIGDDAAPLSGRTIVTTRDEPGELDRLLAEAGALVLHVPLIAIDVDPVAATAAADAIGRDDVTWLVATSQHGARAVASALRERAEVQLAAVGTRTASVLAEAAGRAVDLVPARQTAADLAAVFPDGSGRVLLALGDLADDHLATAIAAKGWTVDVHTVYRTVVQVPDHDVRGAVVGADAVAFASGSAARAWATAIGTATPPIVVAIGPTTADAARSAGVPVTHVADQHDLAGLVATVVAAFDPAS